MRPFDFVPNAMEIMNIAPSIFILIRTLKMMSEGYRDNDARQIIL